MNAVFYSSSSPGSKPFVKENDEITSGATICILEAMKLLKFKNAREILTKANEFLKSSLDNWFK